MSSIVGILKSFCCVASYGGEKRGKNSTNYEQATAFAC